MRTTTVAMLLGLLAGACSDPASIIIEPLRVINWSPSGGAFCIDVNTRVVATFSDDLEADSVDATASFVLRDVDGVVAAEASYNTASYSVTLTPGAPLAFNRLYTLVASTDICGKKQGCLAVDVESSFMTIARSGCTPGVECSLPSDCPGTQICSNVGLCIDECVTDRDCYRGTCDPTGHTCIPDPLPDSGGGDP